MSSKDMDVRLTVDVGPALAGLQRAQHPAGPLRRLVRQADLARDLAVTSQQIDTWRNRSRTNGFPDPVACNIGPVSRGGKRRHLLWDLGECRAWHRRYINRATKGPQNPKQHQRSRQ